VTGVQTCALPISDSTPTTSAVRTALPLRPLPAILLKAPFRRAKVPAVLETA
jgi:hypothetical protein